MGELIGMSAKISGDGVRGVVVLHILPRFVVEVSSVLETPYGERWMTRVVNA